jgi:uncharacterized membrane protein YkvA (DUF1232 family)
MKAIEKWVKQRVGKLKMETYAIYLAYKDPRVPWYAKLFAACVIGYALSPIDLIPDFIPVLGYLDDLVLIPLGIALAMKMIPQTVLTECREKAQTTMNQNKPTNWVAAGIIVVIWFLLLVLAIILIVRVII